MRDLHTRLDEAEVTVLGVSFDTPEANAKFVEAESFPFALLSDSERKLAMAVGAAKTPDQGYARRISYLIERDGTVLVAYPDVDPATHARRVLDDARSAAE